MADCLDPIVYQLVAFKAGIPHFACAGIQGQNSTFVLTHNVSLGK